MRKAGHIRKRVYSGKLDFTIVKKAQVRPQPITALTRETAVICEGGKLGGGGGGIQ